MLIDELFIKARRTVAIKRAQEELNARLASDAEFARQNRRCRDTLVLGIGLFQVLGGEYWSWGVALADTSQ